MWDIGSRGVEQTVSGVGVLDKAMAIVDALDGGPGTLAELVAATGLARATVHRLAGALEAHGLVARAGRGRYALGPRLRRTSLAQAAAPALAVLREETKESVQLYVRRGDVRVCVAALESPHGLRTIVSVGAALPMDRGSAAAVLREDPDVLERGWAESVEERERGVASVSAPVRDVHHGERIVAAISVSGPVERTSRRPSDRYARLVCAAARAVEAALSAG